MPTQWAPGRPSRVTVTRHASAIGWWEMARGAAAPSLSPYVREYAGWMEHMAAPIVRRELPSTTAPLIFNFAAPIRLFDLRDATQHADVGSFITGAYDTAQLVGSSGLSGGLQVNLTLLGLRRLVGHPLEELRNRAVGLDEVFGRDARYWTERLEEAPSWQARFELLDGILASRVSLASTVPAGVHAAWHHIVRSQGTARIRTVAGTVGWSQKHLIDRFRHELGLSPKVLSRIVRFGRVVDTLKRSSVTSLAEVALACGYYDQSHLNRDARAFAQATPGELLASVLPDGGGFIG